MSYTLIAINNYNDYGLRDALILHLESHPNYAKNEPYITSREVASVHTYLPFSINYEVKDILF